MVDSCYAECHLCCVTYKPLMLSVIILNGIMLSVVAAMGEIVERMHTSNISFSLQLTNGPNKVECYITLGLKGLTGTNTQAYWAHSKVTKKMKCFE